MARKKRASLKDKGPDALGLTQKKSKGIDVLFGGPAEDNVSNSLLNEPDPKSDLETGDAEQPEAEDAAVATSEAATEPEEIDDISQSTRGEDKMPVESEQSLTNATQEAPVVPPPAPPLSAEVDELGLPIAMESPPDDLEFAPPAEELELPTGEQDVFDPSLSPFASPTPPPAPELDDDLSALLAEEALTDDDFTEIPADEFLPGVATTPAAETPPPPAGIPSAQPPLTPDPFTTPPAVSPPPPPPVPVPAPATTPAVSTGFPVPRVTVESLGGMVTERIQTSEEDILPADIGERGVDDIIDLKERAQVEKDEAVAARVVRYIGQERRENLDKEIERLYGEVATELSTSKEDAGFALRVLSEAQDIIFEDARQYDEALYRVAVVKTMLARKRNFRRWSYTWGLAVFFYGLVWLSAFIAGFVLTDQLDAMFGTTGEGLTAVRKAWFPVLAGGIGGIVNVFWGLYDHVARKQDFDRQYVMYYLVQPILGFLLGAVSYFLVTGGFLVFKVSEESSLAFTTIGVVLGFIAGFRQRVVFEMIDRIVKKIVPSGPEPEKDSTSLISTEHRARLEPPS